MEGYKFRDGQIVRHRLTGDKVLIIQYAPMASERFAYFCRLYDYQIMQIDQVELEEDI